MSDAGALPASAENAYVVDVTTESFMADVIDASQDRLVLLDLWAPWCGPCKQLTPMLEKLVGQANGALQLAKMNIDEHPAVAQQLKVQSIPAVFAFKAGRPVDGFMGALPESELKAFIEKHADGGVGPSPVETLMEAAAMAMAENKIPDAGRAYADILSMEPTHLAAIAGLAQCHVQLDNLDAARQTLALAPAISNDPDILAARAALALAEKSSDLGDATALLAALAKDENDHQARFDLALAHHGAGRREDAIEALLEIVGRKRDWNDDAARKQLVEFFDAYGAADPIVVAGRRQLSSLLFS
ncbi:thioredoxin [Alphaproteobacteria bacterium]|nr:thioredoxin [Alphaproteobacteria bacterium]